MNKLPVPAMSPEVVERVRQSVEAGKPREEVFAQMRELGLFIGHSIKLTHELYGIPMGDAKYAVHFSRTWADCLPANDAIHQAALEAALLMGATEVELDEHSEPAELQAQSR